MTGTDLTQLGVVGFIAAALLAIAHTGKPLIQALVDAMREGAEARRAVLKRWEDSDRVLDKNNNALDNMLVSFQEFAITQKRQNEIDQKRIQQNDANAAATIAGLSTVQQSMETIRGDLIVAKDSAVVALTNALNDTALTQGTVMNKILAKVDEGGGEMAQIRERLDRLEAKMDTVLNRLEQLIHPPVAPEPSEPPKDDTESAP